MIGHTKILLEETRQIDNVYIYIYILCMGVILWRNQTLDRREGRRDRGKVRGRKDREREGSEEKITNT